MKFHWGTGIALFYTAFVIAMVSMAVRSTQIDIELVQDNYYQHDLDYETFRQKRQNGQLNQNQLRVDQLPESQQLRLQFAPPESLRGEVLLYRPSDHRQDLSYPIRIDDRGQMLIPTARIQSGYWRVRVDWESRGVAYFQENELSL